MVEILTDIPLDFDLPALLRRARVRPDTEYAREFADLLDQARALAKPKALVKESFIESKGDDTVTIDGVTFTSRALRMNLEHAERVFPFVATCGHEMDQMTFPEGDLLKQFWWDGIKTAALGFSRHQLNAYLDRTYLLGKTAVMNPGSGDMNVWPIRQQRELFSLFGDVKALIGVELTKSYLMVPNKTVSGVRFPTEVDWRTCQVCQREDCASRSAPFDGELWESIQHH